jgi:MFS family permease
VNRSPSASPTAAGRRGLTGAPATLGAAYAFTVTMIGTTLPTPLYPIYEQRFGISGLLVTVIFATYAVGVIAALLMLGRVSDAVGRRPVLLAGLACAAASSAVFLLASALAPLLAGRLLSGLSAGIFTGTATATLVDLAPPHARARGTLIATAATVGGLGLGPLLAGLLAQIAPDPLRLPYAVHLGLLAPAAAAIWALREPVEVKPGGLWDGLRVQRLHVPRQVRPVFIRAAVASLAAFAVMGLFTAVAPSLLVVLLHLNSHLLSGAVAFLLLGASAAGQLALELIPARTALPVGCLLLVAGSGLIAGSIAASSLALLLAGAALAGVGTGFCFRGGLTLVNSASPSERRAEVASSFFVVSYLAISVPIVGIGVAAQAVGLRAAGIVFTGLVGLLALAVMASLLRRRVLA